MLAGAGIMNFEIQDDTLDLKTSDSGTGSAVRLYTRSLSPERRTRVKFGLFYEIPVARPRDRESELRAYRDMLKAIRQAVREGLAKGQTVDQVLAGKPSAPFDEEWGGGFLKTGRSSGCCPAINSTRNGGRRPVPLRGCQCRAGWHWSAAG